MKQKQTHIENRYVVAKMEREQEKNGPGVWG